MARRGAAAQRLHHCGGRAAVARFVIPIPFYYSSYLRLTSAILVDGKTATSHNKPIIFFVTCFSVA
ncbi:hypothetical protein A0U89_14985 (plasmid) [Kozakia baliensis]|uniref:Uncharacterized protein n=1 Tax=Kozakia baliensis TaxID=153496 RepID=A0A1D8UYE9_9PROT|nr:hypothetical protein A0U89_14920 [Kozakia baliensis]AOX18615.1 hypothetical protein A0U89_14985 [Kozakia baliensis]